MLRKAGISNLDQLESAVHDVDELAVTGTLRATYLATAVRRLDDALLVSLGNRWIDIETDSNRKDTLRHKLKAARQMDR
jgi:hypothetical protein